MTLFGKRPGRVPRPEIPRWKVIPDGPGLFSSGNPDLDAELGGGYRAGSVNLFEGDSSCGPEDYWFATLPTLLNFLAQGRGALLVPPQSLGQRRLSDRILEYVPQGLAEARVRIIDFTSQKAERPWILPMARLGRDDAMRMMVQAEHAVAGKPRGPFLEVPAIESYEQIVGPEITLRMFNQGFSRVRTVGGLMIVWGRSFLQTEQAVSAMADTRFVVARDSHGLVLRGVRPETQGRQIIWQTPDAGPIRVGLGLRT